MTINERVKIVRTELGHTQIDFGKRIAVGQGYLASIEKGQRDVTEKILKLICREFGVNENWLRTGEGEMLKVDSEIVEFIGSKLDDLDEMDKKIIMEYLKLSTDHRKVIKMFIRKLL
jgi:transcriptional regulator with XRE-family HTH domain